MAALENHIYCPISHQIFCDPVLTKDGIVYEKQEITQWFKKNKTSPITRKNISSEVTPIVFLKSYIADYIKEYPELKDQVYEPTYEHKNYKKEIKTLLEDGDLHKLKNYVRFNLSLFTVEQLKKLFEKNNDEDVLKYIIDNTINLDYTYDNKWKFIHHACRLFSPEIINYIIKKGVNMDCVNNNDNTPKSIILKRRSFDTIQKVIHNFKMDVTDVGLLAGNKLIEDVDSFLDILEHRCK